MASSTCYDYYGGLAGEALTATEVAGRYPFMAPDEARIVPEIAQKLALEPDDRLLEIGCGPGNLLIPLSFRVRRAVGVDHPRTMELLRRRFDEPKVELVGGYFPDVALAGPFEKILIYSVLSVLPDEATALRLVDAAVELLPPGGRLLLGDLANGDHKTRFLDSPDGQAFHAAWEKRGAEYRAGAETHPFARFREVRSTLLLDDRLVLDILRRYRARGLHTYLLPQSPALPFGHTREDVLLVRP